MDAVLGDPGRHGEPRALIAAAVTAAYSVSSHSASSRRHVSLMSQMAQQLYRMGQQSAGLGMHSQGP
jgi:hypothetical protein